MRIGWISAVLLAVLLSVGCNKTSAPPTPIPIEQLPAALEKAFSKAGPELKELQAQVVAALQAQDYGKAYFAMQALSSKPGLNKDQADVTMRGFMSINTSLQAAQAKGDTKAAEVIKYHRENK